MATQLGAVAEAKTVRERMGHGSLAVTSGYMHRVSEADRAAAYHMSAMSTLLDRGNEVGNESRRQSGAGWVGGWVGGSLASSWLSPGSGG
jgi:hypothetical protein